MSTSSNKHNTSTMIGLDVGSTCIRAVLLIVEDGVPKVVSATAAKCNLTGLMARRIEHVINETLGKSNLDLPTMSIGFEN